MEVARLGSEFPDLSDELSIARELLDPVISEVGDVEVVVRVKSQSVWELELALAGAGLAPASHEFSIGVELHDGMSRCVGHEDGLAFAIQRDSARRVLLPLGTEDGL